MAKSPARKAAIPTIDTNDAATLAEHLGTFQHTFTHKDMGEVGTAFIELGSLPPASLRFALQFGLRTILQNTYAGVSDPAEAQGLFNKKLDALLAGNVSTTRTAQGDPIAKEAKRLAEADVKARLRKAGIAFNTVSKEQMARAIDKVLETQGEALRAIAKENLDNAARLAVGEEAIDVNALLGIEAPEA